MNARQKKKQVKRKMDAHLPLTNSEKIWCRKYYSPFRLYSYLSTLKLIDGTINFKDAITEIIKELIPKFTSLAEAIKSSEMYMELNKK